MTRRVVHDGSGKLEISFDYDRDLVEYVKATVPGRAWNPTKRLWTAPESQASAVVEALESRGFEFDEAILSLCAEAESDAPEHFTVSRLNQKAQMALVAAFPEALWVVGQLTDIDKSLRRAGERASRSMVFFKLVEVDDKGSELASIACKMSPRARSRIAAKIARAGNALTLSDETTVRIEGRVELYVGRGSFQLDVTDIDVNYTLGEVARRREAIKRTLRAEGVLERNRGCQMPPLPLRIGLITSLESEAYNDVMKTLVESGFAFDVLAHDARVQGGQTEATVLAALAHFATRLEDIDVVLISRGGGSRTDLAWFDTEALGRAVATFPIPVLVGIGHETDEGVLDDVGWSHKTPTAAASALVERVAFALGWVEERALQILQVSQTRVLEEGHRLNALGRQLSEAVMGRLRLERQGVQARSERLVAGSRHRLEASKSTLHHASHALTRSALYLLNRRRAELDMSAERMGREALRALSHEHERLLAREDRLRLVNPERVLERGYALLSGPNGKTLRAIEEAPEGTEISARLADGSIRLVSQGPEEPETSQ